MQQPPNQSSAFLKRLLSLMPQKVQTAVRQRKKLEARLLSCLPAGTQHWIHTRRNIAAVRKGHRLVPEEALEQKQVEALHYLIKAESSPAVLGDYLEFGVYNGSALACMHRAVGKAGVGQMRLFGFDSFEGLPTEAATDDGGLWKPGQFSMDYEFTREFLTRQGVDWNRVHLIKGWFNETCNDELISKFSIKKASILMVDCDLYSSTKTVLAFSAPLLHDHAVVFFDDWFAGTLAEKNMGEKRAFEEFLQEHPEFEARDFGGYGSHSKAFTLTRVPVAKRPARTEPIQAS